MARSCAMCGKTSMRGYNPQSVGMNRVRAKRRYNVNLQQLKVYEGSQITRKQVCTRCRRTLMKSTS
ncbi:MAG: bL28 family ribosomal protein [Chloroflexota bacterium]